MNLVPPRALGPDQAIKHELVQYKLCSPQDKAQIRIWEDQKEDTKNGRGQRKCASKMHQ